jgi:hypothetical protein
LDFGSLGCSSIRPPKSMKRTIKVENRKCGSINPRDFGGHGNPPTSPDFRSLAVWRKSTIFFPDCTTLMLDFGSLPCSSIRPPKSMKRTIKVENRKCGSINPRDFGGHRNPRLHPTSEVLRLGENQRSFFQTAQP